MSRMFELVTLHNAAAAAADGNKFLCEGFNKVVFQVTGTFVGTITFKGTLDGTNYVAIQAVNMNDGVERQPSRILCGRITKRQGRLAMGIFVNRDGEQKDRYSNHPFCNIESHMISSSYSQCRVRDFPVSITEKICVYYKNPIG